MSYWLQKIFSSTKLKRQLLAIFLVALSLPILVIGAFLIINTKKTMTNHYLEQTEAEIYRVKSILFNVTTNICNLSEDIVRDSALHALLSKEYKDSSERSRTTDSYQLITNILSKETSISTVKIYTANETLGDYGTFAYMKEDITETSWYKKASTTASIFWVTKPRKDQWNEYYELAMYLRIPLISIKSYAILEITVSDNYLKNIINNNALHTISSVNEDSVFYSVDRTLKGQPLPTAIDYTKPFYQSNGRLEIGGQDYIGAITTLQPYKSDDNIYIVSYSEEALPYMRELSITYTCIVLLALLLPCGLMYLYTTYISARVNVLRSAMYQASRGDYNIIDSFQGNDELSETFQDLQVMIDEIQKKESRMYLAQIKEQALENKQQQMEYKMLASQINPHFLYNTLETIRMKAFTSKNYEVATAIKLLGQSLRYVLENTGTASTTLDKELAYIETYLKIQRLRFEDRVNYSLSIESGLQLEQYHILPLLLQPIVENAISHGLEGVESNGQIHIDIYTRDDIYLFINIDDNGDGMNEQELAALQEAIRTKDTSRTKSIGLYNINQRILLCYGSEYRLNIHSAKGEGTSVTLKLPLNKLTDDY